MISVVIPTYKEASVIEETLRRAAAALREQQADLAIASRYVPGGGTSDWTWMRRAISRTATHVAATVLPLTLAAAGKHLLLFESLWQGQISQGCDFSLAPPGAPFPVPEPACH